MGSKGCSCELGEDSRGMLGGQGAEMVGRELPARRCKRGAIREGSRVDAIIQL